MTYEPPSEYTQQDRLMYGHLIDSPISEECCESCSKWFPCGEMVKTLDGPWCAGCMKDYADGLTPEEVRAAAFVVAPTLAGAVEIMSMAERAICHIHGSFYSGYAKCPACDIMRRADEEGEDSDTSRRN